MSKPVQSSRESAQVLIQNKPVIPAKAGTHSSTREIVEAWIPAFAGMTIFFSYLTTLTQRGGQQ
jgi:hypothetical protein